MTFAERARTAAVLVEDLHRRLREPHIDLFAHKLVGHGVEVLVGHDIVVYADFGRLPLQELVSRRRQRVHRRFVQVLEELSAS